MKKKLLNSFRLRALAMIAVLCAGVSGAWGGTYSYTFSGKQFSSNTSVALGDVSWTLAGNGNYHLINLYLFPLLLSVVLLRKLL